MRGESFCVYASSSRALKTDTLVTTTLQWEHRAGQLCDKGFCYSAVYASLWHCTKFVRAADACWRLQLYIASRSTPAHHTLHNLGKDTGPSANAPFSVLPLCIKTLPHSPHTHKEQLLRGLDASVSQILAFYAKLASSWPGGSLFYSRVYREAELPPNQPNVLGLV